MNRLLMIASLSLLFPSVLLADIRYRLDALPGDNAGSKITGFIVVPDSAAGLTVWDMGTTATDFQFESDFGDGLVFEHLFVDRSSQFDAPIGDPVLNPVLPDVSPGFPDFAFANNPLPNVAGDFVLGLAVDAAGTSVWNLVETGVAGNQDFATRPSGAEIPAWRLVLVPEPSSLLLLVLPAVAMLVAARKLR